MGASLQVAEILGMNEAISRSHWGAEARHQRTLKDLDRYIMARSYISEPHRERAIYPTGQSGTAYQPKENRGREERLVPARLKRPNASGDKSLFPTSILLNVSGATERRAPNQPREWPNPTTNELVNSSHPEAPPSKASDSEMASPMFEHTRYEVRGPGRPDLTESSLLIRSRPSAEAPPNAHLGPLLHLIRSVSDLHNPRAFSWHAAW